MRKDKNIAYGLVLVWAYLWILFKHLSAGGFNIQYPSVIITAIVCLALLIYFVVRIFYKNKIMINALIAFVVIIGIWSAWGFFGSRVEQADYTVVKKMNGYEIREYPAHIVAQTTVQGSYGESMGNGFSIVAGDIFGGNTKKESIAMTAPVIAQKGQSDKMSQNIAMTAPVVATTEGDSQIISFGMPRSYTLDTLPTPNDPRVKIVMIPANKYAVMQFSWYRSDARIKMMQEKLASALARDGVVAQGSTAYAGYNAPWTPPWMIRNEVLVEILN